jgi:hypothetical protein
VHLVPRKTEKVSTSIIQCPRVCKLVKKCAKSSNQAYILQTVQAKAHFGSNVLWASRQWIGAALQSAQLPKAKFVAWLLTA